ncbi:DUF2533 family protein [Bacillus solimangrovi]|uniref:DUF2533 domain-containing protein n=1 Tax=Bacillus solimangrovi TaxID=1305675 RepID=A0A1E5LFX8_9BACI|nr:DUF2533 family protein [Bacillus solimangrovi]OEH92972.1 hypothetical protein BFG57_13985 [Bacillus solimangrovi]
MSVHHEITKHSKKQHKLVNTFHQLEAQREAAIDRAVARGQAGESIDVSEVNLVTQKINDLSKFGPVPNRKYVTVEMVQQYIDKIRK